MFSLTKWPFKNADNAQCCYFITAITVSPVAPSCKQTDPMTKSLCEAQTHAVEGLEELVGEVLCEKGKHEIGSLRVGPEGPPLEQPLHQHLRVRKPSSA